VALAIACVALVIACVTLAFLATFRGSEEELRLEGMIDMDPWIEGGGCGVLEVAGTRYLLIDGPREALVDRRYVVLHGTVRHDMVTGCAMGTVFEVHKVDCSTAIPPTLPSKASKVPPCSPAERATR